MMMSYEEMFAQGYAFRMECMGYEDALDSWEDVEDALQEAEECDGYQWSEIHVDHEAREVVIEIGDDE